MSDGAALHWPWNIVGTCLGGSGCRARMTHVRGCLPPCTRPASLEESFKAVPSLVRGRCKFKDVEKVYGLVCAFATEELAKLHDAASSGSSSRFAYVLPPCSRPRCAVWCWRGTHTCACTRHRVCVCVRACVAVCVMRLLHGHSCSC